MSNEIDYNLKIRTELIKSIEFKCIHWSSENCTRFYGFKCERIYFIHRNNNVHSMLLWNSCNIVYKICEYNKRLRRTCCLHAQLDHITFMRNTLLCFVINGMTIVRARKQHTHSQFNTSSVLQYLDFNSVTTCT